MKTNKLLLLLSINILLTFSIMVSIFPIAPVISADLGMTPEQIGSMAGIASLIMTFLSIPAGVLADRYGRKKIILFSMTLSTLALAVVSFSQTALLLSIGWMVFGFSRGFLATPIFAVVTDVCKPEERGKAMGMVSGAIGAGSVLGYVLSGLISDHFGWHVTFEVLTALLLAASLATFLLLKETGTRNTERSIGKAFKLSFRWLGYREILFAGIVGTLCFMVGNYTTFLVPFAAKEHNISLSMISLLFIPYEAVASFGAVLIGWASDRFGRRTPLILSQLVCVGALLLLGLLDFSPALLAVTYAFIGLTEGPIITVVNTIITDKVVGINPREIGTALGTFRTLQGIGVAFGSSLGGFFYSRIGTHPSYLVGVGILAVTLLLSLTLGKRAAHGIGTPTKQEVLAHDSGSNAG
ncbi:MFS transporter [Gorillibacterium sp. sgz500922]|uniref:MFS transporter n=1 Tax=Gorillibacterium sp. sgz500922 TaxID=3446694 RepID=UPI003F67F5BD